MCALAWGFSGMKGEMASAGVEALGPRFFLFWYLRHDHRSRVVVGSPGRVGTGRNFYFPLPPSLGGGDETENLPLDGELL